MKRDSRAMAALALVGGFIFLLPVIYGVWMSLQSAEGYYAGRPGLTFGNYEAAFGKLGFLRYLLNSLIVSAVVTVAGLAMALLVPYAFARFRFRGQDLLFGIVLATLMIPSHVTLIPNYLNLARVGLLDSYAGLILPAVASGFVCLFLRQYIRGIPRAPDEAAFIDRASCGTVLWRVIVPLSKPALFSIGLFLFLSEWNRYIWPLVMAASTITMIPVLIGFVFVERHLVRGIAVGGVK